MMGGRYLKAPPRDVREEIELGGDFDAGQKILCVRYGDIVIITANAWLAHSAGGMIASAAGVIPAIFRPVYQTTQVYAMAQNTTGNIRLVTVSRFGDLFLAYSKWDGSVDSAQTTSAGIFSVTYPAPPL